MSLPLYVWPQSALTDIAREIFLNQLKPQQMMSLYYRLWRSDRSLHLLEKCEKYDNYSSSIMVTYPTYSTSWIEVLRDVRSLKVQQITTSLKKIWHQQVKQCQKGEDKISGCVCVPCRKCSMEISLTSLQATYGYMVTSWCHVWSNEDVTIYGQTTECHYV